MRLYTTYPVALLLIVVCFCVGCEPNKTTQPNNNGEKSIAAGQPPAQHQPDATARQILAATTQRYAQAKTYQDRAVLYLSYILNGQRLEEPKRWSTKYSSTGLLAAEMFNTKINGNGKVLGCEIFDVETANLDNQTLAIPYGDSFGRNRDTTGQTNRIPLKVLLRDPIARKYVAGFSEMPLEPSYENEGPWLIPPPLSLLTQEITNPWLQAAEQTERRPDEKIDAQSCYVVRSRAQGLSVDVWINQADLSIVQMSLPLKLLADEVVTSNEVSEVVLLAKFHDATFDQPIADTEFKFTPRSAAVLVRKLVSLPEALPSELIGETAPKFQLRTAQGQSRQRRFFDGKTSVLVWLSGQKSIQTAAKLKPVFAKNNHDDFEFGIVFSDTDTQQPGSGQPTPSAAIAQLSRDLAVPAYYDRQHTLSSQLKIKAIPAAVVLDGDGRVQYVATLSGDDWDVRLTAAIKRVAAGDDLAQEMLVAYERYLDTYHQQLAAVSANGIAGLPNRNQNIIGPSNAQRRGTSANRLKIRPKQMWRFDQLKQPGNVVGIPTPNGANFAIFDGQQTLAMLDSNGQLIKHQKLELDDGEPATTVRAISNAGKTWLAVFALLGQEVHLLDQQLNQQSTFHSIANEDERQIFDVQFYSQGNKPPQLLVAFKDGGVGAFELNGNDSNSISKNDYESLAVTSQVLAGVSQGRASTIVGDPLVSQKGIQFVRLAANGSQLIGLGQNAQGKWNAIGLDDQLQQVWAIETGAQLHENFLSPIASAKLPSGQPLWAVADSNQMVHLVAGSGQWLGEFEAEGKISGLCLQTIGARTVMVISSQAGVECWDLGL